MMTTLFPMLDTPDAPPGHFRACRWRPDAAPASAMMASPRSARSPEGQVTGLAHFIASDMVTDSLGVSYLNLQTVYGGTAEAGATISHATDRHGLWPRRTLAGSSDKPFASAPFAAAVLAFHDAVARTLGSTGTVTTARRQTIWHYQWLVMNVYLPTLEPAVPLLDIIDAVPARPSAAQVDGARRAIVTAAEAQDVDTRRDSLIAETLHGLIACDARGYWNAGTAHGGRWSPLDGVRPDGVLPDSLAGFFAVAAG